MYPVIVFKNMYFCLIKSVLTANLSRIPLHIRYRRIRMCIRIRIRNVYFYSGSESVQKFSVRKKVCRCCIAERMSEKAPLRVVVTGAAGQIAYSLLYQIASGYVFGEDQVK
jgi:hypothetical protein